MSIDPVGQKKEVWVDRGTGSGHGRGAGAFLTRRRHGFAYDVAQSQNLVDQVAVALRSGLYEQEVWALIAVLRDGCGRVQGQDVSGGSHDWVVAAAAARVEHTVPNGIVRHDGAIRMWTRGITRREADAPFLVQDDAMDACKGGAGRKNVGQTRCHLFAWV